MSSVGGVSIQDECNSYMKSRGRQLQTSEVFVSSAGKLPCKFVIHTVGPKWQGGSVNEDGELYDAIYNCLKKATEHKCTSVALPAVSSGIFGFPLARCCKTITEAIVDYCKQEKSMTLREVCIIDNQRSVMDGFDIVLEEQQLKASAARPAAGRNFGQVPEAAAMARDDGKIISYCCRAEEL